MPDRWKFPRASNSWSNCQWCGQSWPSNQVFLNPRFGWQCPECFDGLIQSDQVMQPIFPYEGTRKTPAPVTNTLLEGTAATSAAGLQPNYTYVLEDRITGELYEVVLPPLFVNNLGLIVYFTASIATVTLIASTEEVIFQGIRINNGWDVYVRSGVLSAEKQPNLIGVVDGICDFGEITSLCTVLMTDQANGNVYSVDFSEDPPTLTEVVTEAPTFDAVQINGGWFLVSFGVTLFSTETPPSGNIFSNDCIEITVDEDGNQTNPPPPGNGGGGGVGPLPDCVSDVLTWSDDFEEGPCDTNVLVKFDDFEAQFCDTPNLEKFDDFETA